MATLVVISAKWCGPCADLKEELTQASVPFTTVDVDTASGRRLADRLGVDYVPAVFLQAAGRYLPVQAWTARGIAAALERHRGK